MHCNIIPLKVHEGCVIFSKEEARSMTQKKKRNPKKFKIMVHRQRMQIDERSSSNVVNNVLMIFYPFSQKNININKRNIMIYQINKR